MSALDIRRDEKRGRIWNKWLVESLSKVVIKK